MENFEQLRACTLDRFPDKLLGFVAKLGIDPELVPKLGNAPQLQTWRAFATLQGVAGIGIAMTLRPQRTNPSAAATPLPAFAEGWGPYVHEARAMYVRARQAGMSLLRSTVAAFIASYKNCWAFRRKIAATVGVSVRTVQRAITQGQDLGLLNARRGKRTEVPPGARGPVDCGFSHRWTTGFGEAGKNAARRIAAAVERCKMRRVLRVATRGNGANPLSRPTFDANEARRRFTRGLTVEQLNAELERIGRERGS